MIRRVYIILLKPVRTKAACIPSEPSVVDNRKHSSISYALFYFLSFSNRNYCDIFIFLKLIYTGNDYFELYKIEKYLNMVRGVFTVVGQITVF